MIEFLKELNNFTALGVLALFIFGYFLMKKNSTTAAVKELGDNHLSHSQDTLNELLVNSREHTMLLRDIRDLLKK